MKKQTLLFSGQKNSANNNNNKSRSPFATFKTTPPKNVFQKTPPKSNILMGVTFSAKNHQKIDQ